MEITTDNKNLVDRLFAAGSHFGLSKSRRHPTMVKYLFGTKQGSDIINLEITADLLEAAKTVLNEAGKNSQTVLLVGTKAEAVKLVTDAAAKAEVPYVANRWVGGTLTNLPEIKKRIERLKTLIGQGESGELEDKYTKKERVLIGRELDKLNFNFNGIKDLNQTPALLVVVDPKHDSIAVEEAEKMKIPIVGIMNSDCNAQSVTHPIIVNDSLTNSIYLILNELTDALIKGREEAAVIKSNKENKSSNNERTTLEENNG